MKHLVLYRSRRFTASSFPVAARWLIFEFRKVTLSLLKVVAVTFFAAPSFAQSTSFVDLSAVNTAVVMEDDDNPADNVYEVRSLDGSHAPISFEMPTDLLIVLLGAGNDDLTIDGLQLPNTDADFCIFGTCGDDRIKVQGAEIGGLYCYFDGTGDSVLNLLDVDVAGDVRVFDGTGRQTLQIADGCIGGDLQISSSGGSSQVDIGSLVQPTLVDGAVKITNAGSGDDNLTIIGRVSRDVTLNAGDGDASFLAKLGSCGGSLDIAIATGEVDFKLVEFSVAGSINTSSGEGDTNHTLWNSKIDEGVSCKCGDGFDQFDILGLQSPTLLINNGAGGSRFQMRGRSSPQDLFPVKIDKLTIVSGHGRDELSFVPLSESPTAMIGELLIDTGVGDSVLDVTDVLIDSVTLTSETGSDVVTFDTVEVTSELIVATASSRTDYTFRNSGVGGGVDIRTGRGSDQLEFHDSWFGDRLYVNAGQGFDFLTLSGCVFDGDVTFDGGSSFDFLFLNEDTEFTGLSSFLSWELAL